VTGSGLAARAGPFVLPAAFVAAGLAIAWVGSGYSFIGAAHWAGPAVFPILVGCGMALTGAGLLVRALVLGVTPEWGERSPGERLQLGHIAILLATTAVFIVALRPLGSTLTAAFLFAGTELAFGKKRLLRAALCGAVVGFLVYVVFGRMLGLPIPPGPLVNLVW
jgi:putative tricarboxylic transport membrane protein